MLRRARFLGNLPGMRKKIELAAHFLTWGPCYISTYDVRGPFPGTRLITSDDDNDPHTTTHNSHQFLWESHHQPLEVVGVPRAFGRHVVASQDALAMTATTGLRWRAGNNSPAIMPARSWRLASHVLDRCRSWSMNPGIRPMVTWAYLAWHFQFLTFPPCPASWARTAFTLATRGVQAQALGNTRAAMAAAMAVATATASWAGGGQGGWNHHWGGHHHLRGQISPQHWGGSGGGNSGGGGGGKNDYDAEEDKVVDMAAGGGGSRHFMWRDEQIKQFACLIRGGEAAVGDERL
jgi:hypothetical protein